VCFLVAKDQPIDLNNVEFWSRAEGFQEKFAAFKKLNKKEKH
jgi:hypothetical protein